MLVARTLDSAAREVAEGQAYLASAPALAGPLVLGALLVVAHTLA